MADSRFAVYVSNADSNEILVLQLNPKDGSLAPVQRVPAGGAVMPMALSPDRRYLYAAVLTKPYSVVSFKIGEANGELTPLASTPVPGRMPYLATDQSGKFLFTGSFPQKNSEEATVIAVSAIDPEGRPKDAHQVIATDSKIHAILPDPSNRHVISTCFDTNSLFCQRFDAATGALSLEETASVQLVSGCGPRHFVFHPNGRFLYLLNETNATIDIFSYGQDGALQKLQTVSALPEGFAGEKPHAADLRLTPDGRFLYASERISNMLAAFSVDAASGLLAAVGHFPTEQAPRGFNIDPQGKFLLAVGRRSNSLTCYAIDAGSGALRSLARYPMGEDPNWVEIVELR